MTQRRLDIQGLRAIAVLLVVITHAGLPLPGGFIGVDVFFVISGFVITNLLQREWQREGRIDLRAFYARRVRRLLPALALVVAVTCVGSALLQSPNGEQQQTAQTAIGAMALVANIVIPRLELDYFARASALNPLLHVWSLSAEEQFYLLFPAIMIVGFTMSRRRQSRVPPVMLIGLTAVASLGFLLVATYRPHLVAPLRYLAHPFYSSIGRAWEFAVGAIVALAEPGLRRWLTQMMEKLNPVTPGFLGVCCIFGAAVIVSPKQTFPGVIVLLPVLGTALALASGSIEERPAPLLTARPLVWLGDLSYSWYLWHWPALVFGPLLMPSLPRTMFAAMSLLPAYLSYRFVEQPIRQAPNRRRSWMPLAAIAGGTALAAASGLGFGAKRGWGQPWTLGAHVAKQRGCDNGLLDDQHCLWQMPGAKGLTILVGDSQAWAIADGVIPAAAALGHSTVVLANNFGCPFALAADPQKSSLPGASCITYNTKLIARISALQPALVVIANQSAAHVTDGGKRWHDDLSKAIAAIHEAGAGVLIVNVVPLADEQTMHRSLLFVPSGERFIPRAPSRQMQDAHATESAIAAENPDTGVFNPATILCEPTRCRVADATNELYTDTNHLSRPGALTLEPAIREAMARVIDSRGENKSANRPKS